MILRSRCGFSGRGRKSGKLTLHFFDFLIYSKAESGLLGQCLSCAKTYFNFKIRFQFYKNPLFTVPIMVIVQFLKKGELLTYTDIEIDIWRKWRPSHFCIKNSIRFRWTVSKGQILFALFLPILQQIHSSWENLHCVIYFSYFIFIEAMTPETEYLHCIIFFWNFICIEAMHA